MTHDQEHPRAPGGSPARPGPAPGEIDERVASGIRELREKAGKSQADVAREMKALGWPYHPQTVHRIETGARKVTVGEGHALARVLGTSLERLTWADPESAAAELVAGTIGRLRREWLEAAEGIARLLAARHVGGARSAEYRDGKYALAREVARELEAELADATLERAIAEGHAMWERLKRGDA